VKEEPCLSPWLLQVAASRRHFGGREFMFEKMSMPLEKNLPIAGSPETNKKIRPETANETSVERQTVGKDLLRTRQDAGLSREEVRKLFGHWDKNELYRWESDRRIPNLESAMKLAIIYDCSIETLCPSLWDEQKRRIEERRVKLASENRDQKFKNMPAGRRASWEIEDDVS
jgi:transcriptional regulator with XRE-family HTH domain